MTSSYGLKTEDSHPRRGRGFAVHRAALLRQNAPRAATASPAAVQHDIICSISGLGSRPPVNILQAGGTSVNPQIGAPAPGES